MTVGAPVRVVLVDDHPVVRDGLRASLESVSGFDVVGEAGSGEEALDVVAQTRPDVVLMDLQMAGMGGIAATRVIVDSHPTTAVLVLTMYADPDVILLALRAGARGYVLKGAQQADVVRTIAAVARGDTVLGQEVSDRLLPLLTEPAPVAAFPQLSNRERQILELVAKGLQNAAIGRHLHLSPRTVANHVSNILTKTGSADRGQLVIAAREAGVANESRSP